MFDHIGLHVTNLDASARFYEAALAPLGFVLGSRDATSAGFGPPDAPALWLYSDRADRADRADTAGTAAHLAFRATTRAAVDKFHQAGAAAGGNDHGKPGVRADYAPTYYAAFLKDPDGNNVEAVCLAAP
jgi:catechol 2,3-dioxygenase-like lactoylglutathione lyase family enzyme